MSAQTRIQWSPKELKSLHAWLLANRPEGDAQARINAAQNAVIETKRIRIFQCNSAAEIALRRINDLAAPVGVDTTVPLGKLQSITVHAEQAGTALMMTPAEFAKFGAHLKQGTKIELV